jgi:outer membrane receptor protein involved in Fe transport
LLGSLATGLLAAAAAPALAAGERPIDIPAGPLEQALAALSAQTGDQLAFAPATVAGKRAPALAGRFTTEQALQRLLAAHDVEARRTGPRIVVLKPRQPPPAASARPTASPTPPAASAPPAPRPFGDEAGASAGPGRADVGAGRPPPALVDEVTVTGTHIRGGSPAAPLVVIDREALRNSGYATVAQALQALPQTFGGESTEGTVITRGDRLATNTSYGTSVNLRGLGADATLVLVNGRRLAGSGNKGDFADLSGIPAIALERVEVLLDGASALYGSDAVGGVVNVILRRDLDGGEVRLRGGAGTAGEPREGAVGVVFGRRWDSGGLLLAYEGYRREALSSDDRDFAASADLRPRGGADRRETFAFPGNLMRLDPATGVNVPYWGVPAGQDGLGLRPADFQAGGVNLRNQNQGLDLLPSQRRHSAYLSARQDVSPALEVSGDVRFSHREVKATSGGAVSTLTVGRNNPYFVSPTGAATHQIQFSFGEIAPHPVSHIGAEALSASLGATLRLPRDWRMQAYGAHAQEITESFSGNTVHTAILAEALGNVPDNPLTAFNAARDGYFNPFAGTPGANSPAVIAAITSSFSQIRYRSRVSSLDAQLDGTLFQGPGGPAKLALGANLRRETFDRRGTNFGPPAVPTPQSRIDGRRTVIAGYAELQAPLAAPDQDLPGLRRLEVSAAVRWEDYSDFGRTLNPRVSLQWSPVTGLTLRGTYGQSYRAPAFQELADRRTYSPVRLQAPGGGQVLALALQGGNPDLGPETATSWTLGLDAETPALPGARLSVTGFMTDFDDRIDRPVANNRLAALVDPAFAAFVQRIAPATNPADLALITALLADPATSTAQGAFPATDYGAIVDQRYVNTAGLKVAAIDVQASWSGAAWGGRLTLGANASRLLRYEQRLTPTSGTSDLVGRATYPAKFRARVAADWTRGALGLGATVNSQSGFRDALGTSIAGQTTLDLRGRLTLPGPGVWAGTGLSLSVRNVFDKAPPFYDNPFGFGFDPASADVVGRFVAIELSRSW